MDAESLGKIAEATGKGIGAAWLIGHHARNAWKAWEARRPAKEAKSPAPPVDDAQVQQKTIDAEEGRLIREAVFTQLDQAQQIEGLQAQARLKDEQVATLKDDLDRSMRLASQYQEAANEWHEDSDAWRKRARAEQRGEP